MDGNRKTDYTREDCYTVQLLNAFIYKGPYGKHFCMVFEILGVNLLEIIKRYKYKGIPIHICRKMARQILIGLHYLHKHCGIIHTDLKPENVMMTLSEKELEEIINHKQLYKNEKTEKRLKKLREKIMKKNEAQNKKFEKNIKIDNKEKENEMDVIVEDSKKNDEIKNEEESIQINKESKEEEKSENKIINEKLNEEKVSEVIINKEQLSSEKELNKKEEENNNKVKCEIKIKEEDIQSNLIENEETKKLKNNTKTENIIEEKEPILKNNFVEESKDDNKLQHKETNENNKIEKTKEKSENILENKKESNDKDIDNSKNKSKIDTKKVVAGRFNENVFDLSVGLNSDFKIKIADLGNGCWTHYHFQPEIQTRQYRGPEVILGINYNETADLWSLACMIFEMLTGDFLFDPKKSKEFKKNDDHLAQMVELLNEFPKDWCTIGTNSKKYFTREGKLKKIKSLQFWGLKDILMKRYKMDEKEAIALEDFLLPMLRIKPEDRASAEDMINHYWLDMKSTSYKNKNPIFKHQNDPERFEIIINSTDVFADVSEHEKDDKNIVDDDDDEEFVIKGKIY